MGFSLGASIKDANWNANLLGEASRKDWFAPTTCVLLWAIVFSTGAVVGSEKYIKTLKEYFDPFSFILATFTFPYTNAVFLVCISGFLGGLVSNADVSFAENNKDIEYLLRNRGAKSYAYMSERPAIAMVRSFAVYIIYIAASSIGLAGGENGLKILVFINISAWLGFCLPSHSLLDIIQRYFGRRWIFFVIHKEFSTERRPIQRKNRC